MKEQIRQTIVITTKAVCDCGGEFKRDIPSHESPFDKNSGVYTYICDKCGKVEKSKKLYPNTRVEGN